MVVGVGIHPGLARMIEFLERFQIPFSIVSFEVFKPADGPKLLVIEIIEEPIEPPQPKRKYTVEAIRGQAVEAGVVKEFDRFIAMSKVVGLAVQPQRASIRIAPPQNRTRYLMYAAPHTDAHGSGLWISVGGLEFCKFSPERNIDEGKAVVVSRFQDMTHLVDSGEFLARCPANQLNAWFLNATNCVKAQGSELGAHHRSPIHLQLGRSKCHNLEASCHL